MTSALPKVLIVGAGAVGLRTAQEALRRGCRVVVRAPFPPLDPRTCSVGAGGLWMPFRCDDVRVDRWALETFQELYELQQTLGADDLVETLPALFLLHESTSTVQNEPPTWTKDPRLMFRVLALSEIAKQSDLVIPPVEEFQIAGYSHAWLFYPLIVNAARMLEYLLQQVQQSAADVDVETGEYMESIEHMMDTAKTLGCNAVINCTGLGAAQISGCESDDDLMGARGILLQYDRTSCVRQSQVDQSGTQRKDTLIMIDEGPWGSDTMPCYLIPRGDQIVVGGSYLPGDTESSIRPDERQRLLSNAHRLGIDVHQCAPRSEWTGFRPKRSAGVRCEVDLRYADSQVKVLHNYGHGGSGWTINVGAAKECLDILLSNKLF
ncbi:D-amino-acid oxidase [Fistulifera solaris]|uniref:D-amino-acid oxidase n=1 Tax=Fistulifera solaris TaxID=1519565 RepID=A0A1Z5J7V2_FISSO|nr:D-amino-acid oxidase [Fistulifera solaris]|eukprot:GAX09898.1 D-amino-acid oxidase [Fistulifera solaris]